jgi:gliding motility-associated-like protein
MYFNVYLVMFKKVFFLFFILFNYIAFFSQSDSAKHIVTPHASPTLRFTENKGQWDNKILFRAQLDGGALFLEKNCLTFNFYDKVKYRSLHHGGFEKGLYKNYDIKCHAYKVHFENCNPNVITEKAQVGSDYENFYLGKDSKKWQGNVRNYHQIFLRNLYNGIDYEAITTNQGIKYNFHLKPNANANDIKLKYEGIDKIKLKNGALILKLEINEVVEQKPYAYQIINGLIKQVICNYKFENNVLSFDFPNGYDKNYELVIDPVLVFAAQSGSLADNFGMTATFDLQGNLFSGGTVFGAGYPFVVGSYSNIFNGAPAYGNTDVVVTKYNATGTSLIYSTYLGGNGTEVITSMIVDKQNNLYCYGATGSSNFPITAGAAYPLFNGGVNIGFLSNGAVFFNGTDIYITKFNPAGTALLGSTYYGGSGNDGVNYLSNTSSVLFSLAPSPGTATTNTTNYDSLQTNYGDTFRGEIQLDTLNNVYIASSTRSSDLPIIGGFDNTLGGKQDGLIAKFNTNLTALVYSSFIGGSNIDCGNGLFVLPNFEVFVTGGTTSTNFPNTAGGQSATYNGGKTDGFLTKVSSNGATMLQSTYIGTTSYDNSFCVQCNNAGEPHVYGQSTGNMPIVNSGTIIPYNNPGRHQFITKYNTTLTTKLMSTVFGSNLANFDISPSAFAVDECNGNIYLSGWGGNILGGAPMTGMPLLNPTQSTTNGYDFYLMALSPNAGSLLYGSYFGGNISEEHVDGGTSRFDRKGVIYQSVCAGCQTGASPMANQDFPVTPGAWPGIPGTPNQNIQNNNCNNGVFKIDFKFQNTVATVNSNTIAGCAPLTVTLTNVTPGTGYTWYLGSGGTTSTTASPVITFTNQGTYTVSLVVMDTTKCVKKDSAIKIITVYPQPITAFTSTITQCSNTFSTTNNSTGSGNTYSWDFGDASPTSTLTSPTHTYASGTGNYTIALIATDINGCKDTLKTPITVFVFNPGILNGGTICQGYTTALTASGGTSYTWSPGTNLSSTTSASPISNATATTIYTVQIDNNSQGYTCSRTLTTQVIVFPKPNADFTYTSNPCGGGVNYFDLSVPLISSWQWTLSSAITSTVQNPYNFYFTGGTHTVSLIVTDNNGCKDTADKVITVLVPPSVSINPNKIICKGDKAVLTANGGISYQWTPTVSLDISNIPGPTASPTANTQYSVMITAANNCVFLLTTNVTLTEISSTPISANAVPQSIVQGEASTLTYFGDPGSIVNWSPNTNVNPKTGYSVSATPDRPTTYTVTITKGPCKETLTVFVDVNLNGCIDSDVFIPNTFTPNADGNNDILYVRGLKVQEVYFAVYNRWGEMVWETNDRTKGWDGIYKGKPADVGVFGWYLKVKCYNGEETFKKGNVTLIR